MTATTPRTATFLLRQPRQTQGFAEPLAEGVALTLLWIPPGRFRMGSPETELERQADEGPQHLVQLQGYFMGQTPITQAQWLLVMEKNPSRFSDQPDSAQRPVEQVSWEEAMEFCRRLSQRTGRHYTLPSEAQWEYACRAGTITPFAFGETISDELANYDASKNYGSGPKGVYRQQTTPVGMFPANAWGLQDMHGNVWEWCLDDWHESYEGAPSDGSAWVDGVEGKSSKSGEKNKLLRGGTWIFDPWNCRSACRDQGRPGYADDRLGFRVVCLPQGPFVNA